MHSQHVATLAGWLAERLDLSLVEREALRAAGLLHDVGKIGVPDRILRKPARLTDDERHVIQQHVTLSEMIIQGIPHLDLVLAAVVHHHERWDGGGYPRGLGGERIPRLGRILAVADAFSAMTLDRPYRKGLNPEVALAEMERAAGTQLDPALVPQFVGAVRARLPLQSPAPERTAAIVELAATAA
jgi:putative nucleotidyltransferase with HDIG domain